MNKELLNYVLENEVKDTIDFEELCLQNMMCDCEDERLGISDYKQTMQDWDKLKDYMIEKKLIEIV